MTRSELNFQLSLGTILPIVICINKDFDENPLRLAIYGNSMKGVKSYILKYGLDNGLNPGDTIYLAIFEEHISRFNASHIIINKRLFQIDD